MSTRHKLASREALSETVAAGVPPAVEVGILPSGTNRPLAGSAPCDQVDCWAALFPPGGTHRLYVSQDGRRYNFQTRSELGRQAHRRSVPESGTGVPPVSLIKHPITRPWLTHRLEACATAVQSRRLLTVCLCLALLLAGCATPRQPATVFRPDKLAAMDAAIETAIVQHKCPGGVLWVEHDGVAYHKAFGNRALVPAVEPMTENTIFDAASLTKVVATTPAVMLLVQRGQVKLEAPVRTYIPAFTGGGKELVTVRELLTHTSGLPPDIETKTDWHGWDTAIQKACAIQLKTPPGTAFRYSDINFFLLGDIVQRVSQLPLQVFVEREIYQPLKMTDTGFLPPADKLPRIAPTEVVDGKPWRGVVHDPTARHMGGVAGHAGLFTTASDLARYARMLLNLGELDGVRIFQPGTVRLMTSIQTPADLSAKRGLGWDIDSAFSGPRGNIFPIGSYGHTGWTGGSLWIDPASKSFVIFLSNRNHPTEAGSVIALRHQLGTLAAQAIAGVPAGSAVEKVPPN